MVRGNGESSGSGGVAVRHVHRWRVESPTGASELLGSCQCGARKSFPAYVDPYFNRTAMDERERRR